MLRMLNKEAQKRTICEAIDELHGKQTSEEYTILINEIRNKAERMEARLLRYRRAIEVLGFERSTDD